MYIWHRKIRLHSGLSYLYGSPDPPHKNKSRGFDDLLDRMSDNDHIKLDNIEVIQFNVYVLTKLLRYVVFEIQSSQKLEMHRMTPEWP